MAKSTHSRAKTSKTRASKRVKRAPAFSAEYKEYLARFQELEDERPKLSPDEFERYDDELLDLLAQSTEPGGLTDEQEIRLHELEFLLAESES